LRPSGEIESPKIGDASLFEYGASNNVTERALFGNVSSFENSPTSSPNHSSLLGISSPIPFHQSLQSSSPITTPPRSSEFDQQQLPIQNSQSNDIFRQFEEQKQKELEKTRKEIEKKREQQLAEARDEIERFYEDRRKKTEQTIAKNRAAQHHEYQSEQNFNISKCWENVAQLVAIPKSEGRDVSRMREVLLSAR